MAKAKSKKGRKPRGLALGGKIWEAEIMRDGTPYAQASKMAKRLISWLQKVVAYYDAKAKEQGK